MLPAALCSLDWILMVCVWCRLGRVNMVLTGAEGVVENGGIINKLGTYTIALAAAAHRTPFYVAAESYKACPSPAA